MHEDRDFIVADFGQRVMDRRRQMETAGFPVTR
jgi:hypothetical protein